MSIWLAELSVYGAYLLLGPVIWCLFGAGVHAGRRRMALLGRPVEPVPAPAPRVTIFIPAKDEGERIGACIGSALRQDYPDFQVVAIDDRSTDETGRIMDEMAAAHPAETLRVLHIRDGALPAGWTGKCNALHTAVSERGDGEYYLFVDSDVVLEPDALSATMSFALRKKCHLVSLLPRMESGSFWESLLVPLAGVGVASLYLIALTNNNHRRVAFANGQYLLVRRDAYEAIGGHFAVRGALCEDVEIARRMKPRGMKIRLLTGTDFATVRMYSSLASILRGWSRNFYAARGGAPARILLAILFLLACCFSSYAAIAWGIHRINHPILWRGGEGWVLTGAIHLAVMTWFIGQLYAWSGNRRTNALLFPLGALGLIAIWLRALGLCVTGKVVWRGTQYSTSTPSVPAVENPNDITGPEPVVEGQ